MIVLYRICIGIAGSIGSIFLVGSSWQMLSWNDIPIDALSRAGEPMRAAVVEGLVFGLILIGIALIVNHITDAWN